MEACRALYFRSSALAVVVTALLAVTSVPASAQYGSGASPGRAPQRQMHLPARPAHGITCNLDPDTPYNYAAGGPIYADGYVTCTAKPDVQNDRASCKCTSGREGVWDDVKSYTTSQTGSVNVSAVISCYSPLVTSTWRTRLHLEGFHGNWWSSTRVSVGVSLPC